MAEKEVILDKDGKPLSKNALKRLKKQRAQAEKKAKKAAIKLAKDKANAQKKQEELEESKKVVLECDEELNSKTPLINIVDAKKYIGKRVKLQGWALNVRSQKTSLFIDLRDGTGEEYPVLQCMLEGDLIKTYDALTIQREASVELYGSIKEEKRAEKKGGVELIVDYWKVVGESHVDIQNLYNRKDVSEKILLDQRHLHVRSEKLMGIMKMRSYVTQEFRNFFFDNEFTEITPPTMVQSQCEGPGELFEFKYFDEVAYMTQSSQLYLEAVLPAFKKVFCIAQSYRAEKARTRRHLSEFTHVEAEMGFINFDDLLDTLEDLVVSVTEAIYKKHKGLLLKINPEFKVPERPFVRMDHSDAVKFCNDNNILNDKGEKIQGTEDIKEAAERKMTDMIGKPILLCRFPAAIKSFYMKKCGEGDLLTESVDLLMPGVGEIIGGSMRCFDYKKLMAAYKNEKIDPKEYYWYTDMRKYGTQPHGGFGLGMERFLCWIMGLDNVRKVCLFPRTSTRISP